jgi:hypothetical protein
MNVDTARHKDNNAAEAKSKSNRIFNGTRWTAILIIPFLVVAWVILYLFPQDTEALFAWPIIPAMTARLMGAGYLAGAYFFIRTATAKSWQTVQHGFLPVTIFAAWMAVTTLLHWQRFSHGNFSFITWAVVYAITPFLVFIVWLRNRKEDPHTFLEEDASVPNATRWIMGSMGVILLVMVSVLYIQVDWLIAIWPWTLSPLTARTVMGFFLIPALTFIVLSRDARWSTHRVIIQGQLIGLSLIIVASALSWSDIFSGSPAGWLFITSGIFVLLTLAVYYLVIEKRVHAMEEKIG